MAASSNHLMLPILFNSQEAHLSQFLLGTDTDTIGAVWRSKACSKLLVKCHMSRCALVHQVQSSFRHISATALYGICGNPQCRE